MWDERIDKAARGLTSGEPGAGFRMRVVARITSDHDTARRGWTWLVAPAAVAAIVIATLGYWISVPGPTTAPSRVALSDIRLQVANEASDAQKVVVTAAARSTEDIPVRRATDPRPDGTSDFAAALSIGPVPDDPPPIIVAPVTISQIQFASLEQSDLIINELSIAPIDVAAMETSTQSQ